MALIDKVTEIRIANEYKSGFNAGLARAQKAIPKLVTRHTRSYEFSHEAGKKISNGLERHKHKNIGAYDPDDDGYLPVVEVPEPTVWCNIHRQVHMRAHVDYMRASVIVRCGEDDWRTLWMMTSEE
jgi:hypothetical protein